MRDALEKIYADANASVPVGEPAVEIPAECILVDERDGKQRRYLIRVRDIVDALHKTEK